MRLRAQENAAGKKDKSAFADSPAAEVRINPLSAFSLYTRLGSVNCQPRKKLFTKVFVNNFLSIIDK